MKCEYCGMDLETHKIPERECCLFPIEVEPDSGIYYECTRPKGHCGPHAGCGTHKHPIKVLEEADV